MLSLSGTVCEICAAVFSLHPTVFWPTVIKINVNELKKRYDTDKHDEQSFQINDTAMPCVAASYRKTKCTASYLQPKVCCIQFKDICRHQHQMISSQHMFILLQLILTIHDWHGITGSVSYIKYIKKFSQLKMTTTRVIHLCHYTCQGASLNTRSSEESYLLPVKLP